LFEYSLTNSRKEENGNNTEERKNKENEGIQQERRKKVSIILLEGGFLQIRVFLSVIFLIFLPKNIRSCC
jgi:hypothetical protein